MGPRAVTCSHSADVRTAGVALVREAREGLARAAALRVCGCLPLALAEFSAARRCLRFARELRRFHGLPLGRY